jgi:hypothetical protein
MGGYKPNCRFVRSAKPYGAHERRSPVRHLHYTVNDEAAAKRRRLLLGHIIVAGMFPQRLGHFLPEFGKEAKTAKESCFMATVFMRLAEQLVDDLCPFDDHTLSVGQLHQTA